jgi:two-component system response regulator QseB
VSSLRILYVEDDPVNRRVMQAMMESTGATLSEAVDGQAGVDAVEAGDFDVILMDLRMPRMDGISAIKVIRARGDSKARTPIIVVTADVTPDVKANCLESGADGIIYKPVNFKELFSVIGRAVAQV